MKVNVNLLGSHSPLPLSRGQDSALTRLILVPLTPFAGGPTSAPAPLPSEVKRVLQVSHPDSPCPFPTTERSAITTMRSPPVPTTTEEAERLAVALADQRDALANQLTRNHPTNTQEDQT